jgi:hypothetical protein
MNHQFLVMWDCNGLEVVADITEDEQTRVWAALKGQEVQSRLPNLNHLMLRARYNSQRNYEIYIVEATEGITAKDIEEMFENSPQAGADAIRRLGHRVLGQRLNLKQRAIV